MKTQNVLKLAFCLIISCSVLWIQCSIIGYSIGGNIGAKKEMVTIPGWEVQKIKPGVDLEIVLLDGQMIKGNYSGLQVLPNSLYEEKYEISKRQRALSQTMPNLGDCITIQLQSGVEEKCRFNGFSCVTQKNLLIFSVIVRRENRTKDLYYKMGLITGFLDEEGEFFKADQLNQLLQEGKIPVKNNIMIKDQRKTLTVAFNEVSQIRRQKTKKNTGGAVVGLLLGATVDALIISEIISELRDWNPVGFKEVKSTSSNDGENMSFSCPFIYSYNGKKYIRDSETFGGAIFEAAQRTDWDNLDYLKAVQDQYHLKITNELLETQYVDEMKIMVVDHPIGSKVMPTFKGQLHVLSNLQKPENAENFSGMDVLELIDKKDDLVWISNPFYRSPDDRTQARDGIILEFSKPGDAQFVKLAFNVQNTLWSSYLQGRMIAPARG